MNKPPLEPTNPWLKVAIAHDKDPEQKLPCPACARPNLSITDMAVTDGEEGKQRLIVCQVCEEWMAVRITPLDE